MASEHGRATVRDNREAGRYEATVEGGLAQAAYVLRGDRMIFTHTEVPEDLRGRGLAGQVVGFALDDARARGLRVVPSCPYVAAYIRRHPEYQALVADEG